jgi:hypothetical protein
MSRLDAQAGISDYTLGGTVLGHYRAYWLVPLVPTQAAGIIWALRWSPATTTRLMVIDYAEISSVQSQPFTATATNLTNLTVARGFTANDTGGATANPAGTNTSKLQTSMGNSLIADVRQVNSAAALGAGTRTLDGLAFLGELWVATITTINPQVYKETFDVTTGWSHPLVLAQNEGLEASIANALPAAGNVSVGITLQWSELEAF